MNFRTISLRVVVALLACLPVAAQTTYNFTDVTIPAIPLPSCAYSVGSPDNVVLPSLENRDG